MGRAMEEHFRDMERMMDGVFGQRGWDRSPVSGKEVRVSSDIDYLFSALLVLHIRQT